jgi:hypothetical protein
MEEEMEGEEAIHIVIQMDTDGYRLTHGLMRVVMMMRRMV